MSGLVFAPDFDAQGESDPGASREFQAQAKRLAMLHLGSVKSFDNELPMVNRGAQVLNALAETPERSLSWIGTCCHGWGRGVQAGFDLRGGSRGLLVSQIVIAIARVAAIGEIVVPLYSCSTAEDPEHGFAAMLSRGLAQAGVAHRLFAHDNAGHATRNPYVRTWTAEGGGGWLIAPGSPRWHRWVALLHEVGSDFHLRYPWMTAAELDSALG